MNFARAYFIVCTFALQFSRNFIVVSASVKAVIATCVTNMHQRNK